MIGKKFAGEPDWAVWIFGAFAVTLLAFLFEAMPAGRAFSPQHAGPTIKPQKTPGLLERGKEIYLRQCAACHGSTGMADGIASFLLYPKARAFSRDRFRLVSTAEGVPTDEDLFRTITRGMPGSAMPAWGHLSAQDRWALVYYVREMNFEGLVRRLTEEGPEDERLDPEEAKEIALRNTTPGAEIPIPPEPPLTTDSLAEGRRVYVRSCASCHGMDGRGGGEQIQKDENGIAISPRDYTLGIFKGEPTGRELFKRIRAGLPGSPMPGYSKDSLSDADAWRLVHYIQSLAKPGAEQRVIQTPKSLLARRVETAPTDPRDPAWHETHSTFVGLMPLWWRNDRIEGVMLRALHDGKTLSIALSYEDPSRDSAALRPQDFTDGVAIQLSAESDPPFFGMGDGGSEVEIWMWKAGWEDDLAGFADLESIYPGLAVDMYASLKKVPFGAQVDKSKIGAADHDPTFLSGWGSGNLISTPDRGSSVENLRAKGLGTLTSMPRVSQTVRGKGIWESSFWQIVFTRDLDDGAGGVKLEAGGAVRIGFAVWDGHLGDRNGQKSVTIWHRLELER